MEILKTIIINNREAMYIGDKKWKCLNRFEDNIFYCGQIYKKRKFIKHSCYSNSSGWKFRGS